MHIDVKVQSNNSNTLEEIIKNNLLANPKKVYIYSGICKENGLELIKNSLKISKSEKTIVIGIDKKNTTKGMLETLIDCTKNVYIYDNNLINEFDASTYIFEYKDKAVVIDTTANLSEGGIRDNFSIYSLIEYDLKNSDDKVQYKSNIKVFLSLLDNENFYILKKSMIQELADSKKIFTTKQYVHSDVKSIADLLGEKSKIKTKIENNFKFSNKDNDIFDDISIELPKIDLESKSVNIEIPKEEVENEININNKSRAKFKAKEQDLSNQDQRINEIKTEEKTEDIDNVEDLDDSDFDNNGTLDIEDMLFTNAELNKDDLKINTDNEQNIKKEVKKDTSRKAESQLKSKKIDIVNVSNLLIQLEKKVTKGQDLNCIKIPNYINETIPNFFDLMQKGEYIEKDGIAMRVKRISLDVVDVKNNQKYNDLKAEIIHRKGQSYIVIKTDIFSTIDYQELDIARIIKLSGKIYHIEIVSKDIDEYKIWDKLCVNKVKLSQRKYGIM